MKTLGIDPVKEGYKPFPDGPDEKLLARHVHVHGPLDKNIVTRVDFEVELKILASDPRMAEEPGKDLPAIRVLVSVAPPQEPTMLARIYVQGVPTRVWVGLAVLNRINDSRSTFVKLAAVLAHALNPAPAVEEVPEEKPKKALKKSAKKDVAN